MTQQIERDPALLQSIIHDVDLHTDVLFTWDYERSRTALVNLYEKAKTSQWNATTDLPWDTEVDWDKLANEAADLGGCIDVAAMAAEQRTARDGHRRSLEEPAARDRQRMVGPAFVVHRAGILPELRRQSGVRP